MSEKISTPISDHYKGSPEKPVELPEHIKNADEVRFDPTATAAEKTAHEAEMARVWQSNKDLEDLFRTVDSDRFRESHQSLMLHVLDVRVAARELAGVISVSREDAKKQVNREVAQALEDEAIRIAESTLPITEHNAHDEDKVYRQRAVLAMLLKSDMTIRDNGEAIERNPETFDRYLKDWQTFEQLALQAEIELAQEQANKENKRYKAGKYRRSHRKNFEKLDEENDGLFGRIRALPIDLQNIPTASGETVSLRSVSETYTAREKQVFGDEKVKAVLSKKDRTTIDRKAMASRMLSIEYMEPILQAVEEACESKGYSGDKLKEQVDIARLDLQEWFTDSEAREGYNAYDRSRNVYEMRLAKAGKLTLRLIGKRAAVHVTPADTGLWETLETVDERDARIAEEADPKNMPAEYGAALRAHKLSSAELSPRAGAVYSEAEKDKKRHWLRRWRPTPDIK